MAEELRGFVFASTGALYTTLARRAARGLRAVMPDCQIDLFTDQPLTDDVFNQIHAVEHDGPRPKMEALRRSRFDRTVFLDADVLVLADVSELFDILDRCDIAATLSTSRSSSMYPPDAGVPRSFPSLNSGVIAARINDRMRDFFGEWDALRTQRAEFVDQPSLRIALWHSELRVQVLQEEYNLKSRRKLKVWPMDWGAPRIIHESSLQEIEDQDPLTPFTLAEAVGENLVAHVEALLAADWMLGGKPTKLETPEAAQRRALRTLRQELRRKTRGQ